MMKREHRKNDEGEKNNETVCCDYVGPGDVSVHIGHGSCRAACNIERC